MLDIERIEKKYDLSGLKYKDIYIWSYLRGVYGSKSLYKSRNVRITKTQKLRVYKKILSLKNIFYGFNNWFRRYEYIFFGDTDSLKIIHDKYGDRMGHGLIEAYGENNVLYIEALNKERHFSLKKSHYKKVSEAFLHIIIKVLQTIFIFFQRCFDNRTLEDINSEYQLNINYSSAVKKFEAEYIVYKILFRIKNPKAIFTTCFTRRSIFKAANDLGIMTVEFQHGVIENNYAYNFPSDNYNNFTPRYLLVYGNNDRKLFEKYKYTNNVITIGNYYLDYIKSKSIDLHDVVNFKYKVIVSLQTPIAKQMNQFINQVASALDDYCFIIVPRQKRDLNTLKITSNVKTFQDYNCYEIVNECDIHISSYSTCLLEVPFFGLTNIFINFENLSNYYYKNYIEEKDYNYIVESQEELIQLLKRRTFQDRKSVLEQHSSHFSSYYLPEINFKDNN